jgi:hypothetical protein
MDDDFQDLEKELKALRPRDPSRWLLARLEREFAADDDRAVDRRARFRLSWKWAGWSALAGAACAVLLAIAPHRSAEPMAYAPPVAATVAAPEQPADVYKPVRADKMLVSAEEEARLTLSDGTPARRVRAQYVDTITWKNLRTNASFQWSVPREEVRVVPVVFQ